MSSPTFESSLPDTSPPPARKDLNLRELLSRERRYHSRIWGIVILALAIALVFILILAVLLADKFDPAWSSWEDNLAAVLFYLMTIAICIAPFLVYPLRYRPSRTRRLMKRSLSPYGNKEELIDAIDAELCDRSYVRDSGFRPDRFYEQTSGHIIFTESWLLWFGWSEFRLFPLADLLWFYKRIEIRSRPWGTTDRVTAFLVCVSTMGEPFLLRFPDEDYVDEALHRLVRRRPDALFGFQGEWRELAETDPAALQRLVTARQAEWQRLSGSRRADRTEERRDDASRLVRRVDSTSSPSERRY